MEHDATVVGKTFSYQGRPRTQEAVQEAPVHG